MYDINEYGIYAYMRKCMHATLWVKDVCFWKLLFKCNEADKEADGKPFSFKRGYEK